jgi:NADPH:quinone reductase-like Zn-dependent oxidoreductase
MKALVYHEYGPPDVLRCEEIQKPSPKDDEILIRVRAASMNPLDWRLMRGEPRLVRIVARMLKLQIGRPGVDFAGVVEGVGKSVTQFKPGDKVFGGCRGAFAEYVCTPAAKVVSVPDNVTFEQGAAINVAGLTALQALRDKARIQPGETVLVNGAAGGVGTFAVQIARTFGAEVTGVCSTRNVEMVKSIGADAVIDYTREDPASLGKRYDVILECIGNKSLGDWRRLLNPRGRHIMIGASHDPTLTQMLFSFIHALGVSVFSPQKTIPLMAKANKEDLRFIAELIADGKLSPVIDRCYQLSEGADAFRYVETGHARGKVLFTLGG